MTETNEYTKLADKLGSKPSARFLNILHEMFTPEECTLLMELFDPATCQEVAARLNADEISIHAMLENLVDRGVITKGKTQYGFHRTVLALHHDVVADTAVMPVPDKLKELWADFFYNEWTDSFYEHYESFTKETGRHLHRVWPAIGALELSPNIREEDLLPEENWKLSIENAKDRIVAPCGCRALWGKCDHPTENTCFAVFDNDRGRFYLDKPGRQLKELSLEETLDCVRSFEEAGLVHIDLCYCCPDACEIMYTLKKKDRWDLVGSSRFVAAVDTDACIGCQVCVDRCYFDAVDMQKQDNSKKLKASIDKEKCKGCGLCVISCKERAMRLEIDKPPEHVVVKKRIELPADLWGFYNLK